MWMLPFWFCIRYVLQRVHIEHTSFQGALPGRKDVAVSWNQTVCCTFIACLLDISSEYNSLQKPIKRVLIIYAFSISGKKRSIDPLDLGLTSPNLFTDGVSLGQLSFVFDWPVTLATNNSNGLWSICAVFQCTNIPMWLMFTYMGRILNKTKKAVSMQPLDSVFGDLEASAQQCGMMCVVWCCVV